MTKKTKRKSKKEPFVEIARSFSYKKNLGDYQSADFFCSAKSECKNSESEKRSEAMYEFCKKEVAKSLNSFMKERSKPEPTIQTEDKVQEAINKELRDLEDKARILAKAKSVKQAAFMLARAGFDVDSDNARGTDVHDSKAIEGELEDFNNSYNKTNLDVIAKRNQ